MYVCMYIYNSVFIVASSNNFFFFKNKNKTMRFSLSLGFK